MTSPALALGWELWRRGRFGLVLLAAFAAVSLAVSEYSLRLQRLATAGMESNRIGELYSQAASWRTASEQSTVVLFGLSFLVTCALCTRVEPSSVRGFTGMPARLFTLPVSSRLLVAVPVGLGIGAVSLLWWGWAAVLFPRVFFNGGDFPNLYFNLLLVAWLVTMQAIVWSLPGFPYSRAVLLTVLVFVGFGGVIAGVQGRGWDPRGIGVLAGLGGWTVLASGLAAMGVAMTRRGRWQGWAWLVRAWDRVSGWFAWRRYFESGASAQFWLEFRRTGWGALGVLAVWDILFLGIIAFWSRQATGDALRAFYLLQWAFTLFPWTIVVGAMVALDPTTRRPVVGSFTGTRPLSTRGLFMAKFWALLAIWGAGMIGSVMLTAQVAMLSGHLDMIGSLRVSGGGVLDGTWLLAIVISFNLLIGLLPLWLTGRLPGIPWSFLLVGFAYVAGPILAAQAAGQESILGAARVAVVPGLLLAKFIIAMLAFTRSYARGLLGGWFVLGWLGLWLLATLSLVAFVASFGLTGDPATPHNAEVLGWVLLTFPLARIGLAPLALEANRHR